MLMVVSPLANKRLAYHWMKPTLNGTLLTTPSPSRFQLRNPRNIMFILITLMSLYLSQSQLKSRQVKSITSQEFLLKFLLIELDFKQVQLRISSKFQLQLLLMLLFQKSLLTHLNLRTHTSQRSLLVSQLLLLWLDLLKSTKRNNHQFPYYHFLNNH